LVTACPDIECATPAEGERERAAVNTNTDCPERDGFPSDPEHIFLTAGASAGVSQILGLALRSGDGCMIPIPQYPLYTATLAYLGAKPIPYYLQETEQWSMNTQVLKDGVAKAKAEGTPVKALAVINPGNPTGACLSREAIEEVVQLCYDESILLLADEVYQRNIFDPEQKPFISFKSVVKSMSPEIANGVELVSFHSISKGVSGECGVDLLVNPPKPGDASYDQWLVETTTTHDDLASRSKLMSERFNSLPGMSCQPAEGAMYLFPKIDIPPKAVEEAKRREKAADVMYTLDLLGEWNQTTSSGPRCLHPDATGICAVAGSGFGQEEGTYHLRVTALCPGVEEYVGKIEKFHNEFMEKWA
jgi:alanine transaminase